MYILGFVGRSIVYCFHRDIEHSQCSEHCAKSLVVVTGPQNYRQQVACPPSTSSHPITLLADVAKSLELAGHHCGNHPCIQAMGCCEKTKLLMLTTSLSACSSFAFLCIAVATDYWLHTKERGVMSNGTNSYSETYTGLWRKCTKDGKSTGWSFVINGLCYVCMMLWYCILLCCTSQYAHCCFPQLRCMTRRYWLHGGSLLRISISAADISCGQLSNFPIIWWSERAIVQDTQGHVISHTHHCWYAYCIRDIWRAQLVQGDCWVTVLGLSPIV